MGNLFTKGMGNVLTALMGNVLTGIVGKVLDIYISLVSLLAMTNDGKKALDYARRLKVAATRIFI